MSPLKFKKNLKSRLKLEYDVTLENLLCYQILKVVLVIALIQLYGTQAVSHTITELLKVVLK